MVEKGVPIKSINIGGMAFSKGKVQITKAVSVDAEDVAAFKRLYELGVKLDLRVVNSDPQTDFMAKIKDISFSK